MQVAVYFIGQSSSLNTSPYTYISLMQKAAVPAVCLFNLMAIIHASATNFIPPPQELLAAQVITLSNISGILQLDHALVS